MEVTNKKKEKKKKQPQIPTVSRLRLTPSALADVVCVAKSSANFAVPSHAFSCRTEGVPKQQKPGKQSLLGITLPQQPSLKRGCKPSLTGITSTNQAQPQAPSSSADLLAYNYTDPQTLLMRRLISNKGFQFYYYCILPLFNDPLTTIRQYRSVY